MNEINICFVQYKYKQNSMLIILNFNSINK